MDQKLNNIWLTQNFDICVKKIKKNMQSNG